MTASNATILMLARVIKRHVQFCVFMLPPKSDLSDFLFCRASRSDLRLAGRTERELNA
jgi:hypothetical protein